MMKLDKIYGFTKIAGRRKMTKQEEEEIIELIDSLQYGEIVIKKEGGKVVHVYAGLSLLDPRTKELSKIKLSE